MGKLPAFEDWKAPWEEKGEDFDAETARKFIYNLTRERDQAKTDLGTVTGERDTLKGRVSELETKDMPEVDRLRRENEELKAKPAEDSEARLENARLRLALEHGLTVEQAARLRGSTPDELAADVPELVRLFKPETRQGGTAGSYRTGTDDGGASTDISIDDAIKFF